MAEALKIVRVIAASAEEVFDAWLDPEAIRVWMCPGDIFESVADMDPRVGGEFEITMRSPGHDDPHCGRYIELDRPRRLSFTWRSAGTDMLDTLVSIDLVPLDDDSCELTLIHSDLPRHEVDSHNIGWKAHLRSLAEHLARVHGVEFDPGFYRRFER